MSPPGSAQKPPSRTRQTKEKRKLTNGRRTKSSPGRTPERKKGQQRIELYPLKSSNCIFTNTPPASHVIKGFLKFRVSNTTRGTVLGDHIEAADTSATRNRGLLKHTKLEQGHG